MPLHRSEGGSTEWIIAPPRQMNGLELLIVDMFQQVAKLCVVLNVAELATRKGA